MNVFGMCFGVLGVFGAFGDWLLTNEEERHDPFLSLQQSQPVLHDAIRTLTPHMAHVGISERDPLRYSERLIERLKITISIW